MVRMLSKIVLSILLLFPFKVFAKDFGAINGFVSDASNGEKLAYANIIVKGTDLGASSNDKGYYFIENVPPGKYLVIDSYMGYNESSRKITVEPGKTTQCNFELEPSLIQMEGIAVSAEREKFEKEVLISTRTLRQPELRKAPVIGEADIFRSIQLLPGVIAPSDFSGQLYVRGGGPDQNLILLDGLTVYNPFHLGGIFSTFNVDALSNAELMAGGFPAEYGGRMSSILDITCKEGNSKRFSASSSISLISAKLLLEGPLSRGSWLVSGRRTYADQILKAFGYNLPYYFYDGMGKVNFDLAENTRVILAGLVGEDVLNFSFTEEGEQIGHIDMRWGNRGISGRWRQVFAPKLYGEGLVAWSNFRISMKLEMLNSGVFMRNEIIDYTIKGDFTYFWRPNHTLDFGWDAKRLSFDIGAEIDTLKLLDYEEKANLLAFYLQDKWEVNPLFIVQAGIRPTYYNPGSRFRWDPRIGLKYRIGANTAINFSLGYYSQFLNTVQSGEELMSIFDLWYPVGEDYLPGLATHYILGLENWFSDDLRLTVEGYYKKFMHLLELSETEESQQDPFGSFRAGSGYATGIDLMLEKTSGKLHGWLAYSLALTSRTFADETYYPRYDRRHNLKLVSGLDLPLGLRLDLKWNFGTGFPYAGVIGRYHHIEHGFSGDSLIVYWENIDSPRDYFRYPPYHRLDLGLTKNFKLGPFNGDAFLEIINVYNRRNIFLYVWNLRTDLPEKMAIPMFPFLPSIGMSARF